MFANNGWIERNPIPPAFSSWGAFNELTERNTLVLKGILDRAAAQAATTTDPVARKLGTFYATCMDSASAERAGIEPIADVLQPDRRHRGPRAAAGRAGPHALARLRGRVRVRLDGGSAQRPIRDRVCHAGRARTARSRLLHPRRRGSAVDSGALSAEHRADVRARRRLGRRGGDECGARPRSRDGAGEGTAVARRAARSQHEVPSSVRRGGERVHRHRLGALPRDDGARRPPVDHDQRAPVLQRRRQRARHASARRLEGVSAVDGALAQRVAARRAVRRRVVQARVDAHRRTRAAAAVAPMPRRDRSDAGRRARPRVREDRVHAGWRRRRCSRSCRACETCCATGSRERIG